MPIIPLKLVKNFKNFANTSIDISDGFLTDLDKMINSQNLSYKIELKNIPISNNLGTILELKNLSKINYISQGDDYQVLFTAQKSKRKIISKVSSDSGVKLTRIGSIHGSNKKSRILNNNNMQISLKNKGYFHMF